MMYIEWPITLGCDASGVVVEAGEDVTKKYNFRPGDYVCGCTRLGYVGYSAGQEYFLMDAHVTIPKPRNISLIEAATLGAGMQTAALAIFVGLKVPLPDPKNLPQPKDEWLVVLGGASSVGKAGIQIARACGFKVIASCSAKSSKMVEALGATTFDYKDSIETQVKKIMDTTAGKISGCFDAVAADDPAVAKELFKALGSDQQKYFATTNDWSGVGDFEGGKTYNVELGKIGRSDSPEANAQLSEHIPVLVGLVEAEKVRGPDYEIVGEGGFEDVIKAYEYQLSGRAGSKKVVVKVQDE